MYAKIDLPFAFLLNDHIYEMPNKNTGDQYSILNKPIKEEGWHHILREKGEVWLYPS